MPVAEVPGGPAPSGSFSLIDHDGRRVNEASYQGFHRLLYFGFTHCKVVCPRTLTKLSMALDLAGEIAGHVKPLYVTVDPERDSAAEMRAFLRAYPRFTGLTGSRAEIEQAKQNFRVFARRSEGSDEDYLVPHSSLVYLMDQDGKYREHFLDSTPPEAIAERLRAVIGYPRRDGN